MNKTDIVLGDEYIDQITGFKGTATAVTFWLHACERVGLQAAQFKDDGTVVDIQWFDAPGVTHVETKTVPKTYKSGGPPARGVETG